MSRIDQHVAFVQNKLAVGKFTDALARALAVFALVAALWFIVERVLNLHQPRLGMWLWTGAGSAALAAVIIAIWRRPSPEEAAVRIDERLNTKDKFATALHVRAMSDPFAQAALLDAERTANEVSLHKRFPLEFPRAAYVTLLTGLFALCLWAWLPRFDLFSRDAKAKKETAELAQNEAAKNKLREALATVATVPQALQQAEKIQLAKESILQQLSQPVTDPAKASRTAAKALQDVSEAIKQQVKENAKFAEAQSEAKMLRQLQEVNDKGPVADAQRAIAKGEFNDAVAKLSELTEKFDKMEKKDQEEAAKQMQNLANQLQQMAQNPDVQKQIQQQLQQQLGMNQQQAQQAQQMMQQAAAGDKQAQQQLQQMAQQVMKQMNNGQGPNPQQQQAIQQMMQQMQAQQNAQQNAQQMQQAAKQMAQAMQQQAAQQGQPQGQNGQQQQQGQQKQMQAGAQQMQQQLQQMQAVQQDMQQIQAAQQNAANAAQQAMNGMNGEQAGNQGQGGGEQGAWQGNMGQDPGGNPNQQWDGQANNGLMPNAGGIGAGDRSGKQQAPFGVKPEMSPSKDDEKGRILASTLVKASALKGESKETLKEVTESALKEAAEEVDQDRVSRQAQRVVREYFGSMQKDAGGTAAPAPTTAPAK